MRTRTAIALASAALTLAACGSDDASSPTPAAAGSGMSDAASYDGPTIPAGTYTKTFTRADVKRLGLTDDDLDPGQLGRDGTGLVVYKFSGSDWTEWSGPDEASIDVGSSGTHAYDDDGNLVFSEPCCGDSVLSWSLEDGQLTMTLLSGEVPVLPIDHLMRDGVYEKTE
jgi:hypothetical protein